MRRRTRCVVLPVSELVAVVRMWPCLTCVSVWLCDDVCTEYLSPELIFNLGHNHASDLWALGVIIYEMLMAVTPFAPKRPDNVTELFTNIAMVKKNGLVLSSRIDQHAGNPQARALIAAILKADPAEYVRT